MEEVQGVASAEEVLLTFSRVLRSEKASEQLKAAEQLAKYYSLFAAKEAEREREASAITAEVEEAVAGIAARLRKAEARRAKKRVRGVPLERVPSGDFAGGESDEER